MGSGCNIVPVPAKKAVMLALRAAPAHLGRELEPLREVVVLGVVRARPVLLPLVAPERVVVLVRGVHARRPQLVHGRQDVFERAGVEAWAAARFAPLRPQAVDRPVVVRAVVAALQLELVLVAAVDGVGGGKKVQGGGE